MLVRPIFLTVKHGQSLGNCFELVISILRFCVVRKIKTHPLICHAFYLDVDLLQAETCCSAIAPRVHAAVN